MILSILGAVLVATAGVVVVLAGLEMLQEESEALLRKVIRDELATHYMRNLENKHV